MCKKIATTKVCQNLKNNNVWNLQKSFHNDKFAKKISNFNLQKKS